MPVGGETKVVLIGGGPAGLTAAYELCKAGIRSIVLEKDHTVGGLARSINYKGYRFDIGGHRFFTKVKVVEDLWHEVLGSDFLKRKRLSRIYYRRKFFYYPLRPFNALLQMGLWETLFILASYFKAQVFPQKPEQTFEQWVSNRFGKRLFTIFFKTYTEKVWGIPCREIAADWATQRIKGLSLLSALKSALLPRGDTKKNEVITTLIDSFGYPRKGPGMMWETMASIVSKQGSEVCLGAEVGRILWKKNKVTGVEARFDGREKVVEGTHFISSMPIRELIGGFEPAAPADVLRAAGSLTYRDFIMVALIVSRKEVFPDNWIYIHEPDVRVGRIQNFKNWSEEMVPDSSRTCLGLEYFCFEGDGLWTMRDEELIELGKKELEVLGLARASEIEDGVVVRMPKAYPIYDSHYSQSLQTVRKFVATVPNLQLVGRNGMHRYNNQDHSMLTAMLAVRNILGGNYDLWGVNEEEEYHEELRGQNEKGLEDWALAGSTQPRTPSQIRKG